MGRLNDKVAVVVGAANGIGRETADLFAREGARLVVADIDSEAVEAVAEGLDGISPETLAVRADVTQVEDCKRIVERTVAAMGRIDVLVITAGVTGRNAIPGSTDAEAIFDRVMDVNLKGSYFVTYHAVPEMRRNGGGSIVFLASVAGLVAYPKGLVPTFIIPCAIRSLFPSPWQEGARRRCRGIVKRPRRPEGAGKATLRAASRGPRTSSRAACDAPASRRATLLAGNLGAPSYGTRNYESGY